MGVRRTGAIAASFLFVGALVVLGVTHSLPTVRSATGSAAKPALWATQHRAGVVPIKGEVPLVVADRKATVVGRHDANAKLSLNFGLPIVNRSTLDALIEYEAGTHHYLSRAQLYKRFSPPAAQLDALGGWLTSKGFRVTHVGADHLALAATATTANVEKTLGVKINDYVRPGFSYRKVKVAPYQFFANTSDPKVPARFGLQTISGLSDIDRFFTQVQLDRAAGLHTTDCGDDDTDTPVISPLCTDVRSGGYFPSDLRSLYDITGHGYDATGQTIGFTLWTTPERQAAMTAYATATGDVPITVDMPSCVATGNSPTMPSSCSTVTVQPDHLLSILENGNSDSNPNFGSNVETALDIEAAHGVATHAGMKYYASDCVSGTPPGSGLTDSGCNGSDVGLEEALEDAANDPTLHSVSNSWAFGGEAEWGLTDPFLLAADNSLAFGAAAGTTFYFSTGDSGTYQSGYPSDSKYVVGVGGTSTYSTGTPSTYSTTTTWSGGGSWCSNIVARPSWQTGAGVTANAPCPGRVIPDVSAVADPNTGIRFVSSTNLTGGTSAGQVGGTSLAAPVMNGLQADTQSFIAAQTYPGTTPKIGWVPPALYTLGNSSHGNAYYRDVVCGNTANPTSGPDGDAAQPGWDAATGWGEPDWFNFATGYAIMLGATNLTQPAALTTGFPWGCAKTPSNSSERSISCPTATTCYAVGAASGGTPWYGKFLPAGAWGAVNTFFKSTDAGRTWFPSNSDMLSIDCTSSSTCDEVGVGGRERRTTDGGNTWSDVATGYDKPLTQITCPSSSICYAVGDRGTALKSTDGGASWSYLQSTDGNPVYGLSCPSTTVCYMTDIYAHVIKTADGGATWTWQQTPITTPGTNVPGSGGPNPFAGLMSITCSDVNTCVATGLYVVPTGQTIPSSDAPIITTTDGGTTWTRRTSNAGNAAVSTTLSAAAAVADTNVKVASVTNFTAGRTMVVDAAGANPETVTIVTVGTSGAGGTGITFTPALAFAHASGAAVTSTNANSPNYLHAVSCLPGTTTCTAVGRLGAIVKTTDLVTWTPMTSNTTNVLNSVECLSPTFCIAVGQNGTVDTYNGTTWTATTGNGGTGMLADVDCDGNLVCYAVGKQGVTLLTTTGGTAWTLQAGGGTTQQMNGISCASASRCTTVGAAGTILVTANGGQSWVPQTSGTPGGLNGVACTSSTACVAVGAPAGASTLSAAAAAGATNIKVGSVTGFTAGESIVIDSGANQETATILTVGTAGATGTGITLTAGLAMAHASGVVVSGFTPAIRTANGSSWSGAGLTSPTLPNGTALNAVACSSATSCTAVGGGGTIVGSADGGATWTPQTSGTTTALNAVACPTVVCYATGAVTGGSAVLVKTTDGATWNTQASHSAQALSGIACLDAQQCFAGGAIGTVVQTTDGTNWLQQGNPLSGPTSELNVTNSAGLGILAAACTASECVMGSGTQADILDSPLLTVTVATHSTYGTAPNLSGIAANDPALSFSPSSEAANVTGALTCSTTATSSSDVGSYPISGCSGLSDPGFSVVYDYADSSHHVVKADQTITFAPLPGATYGDPDFTVGATSSSGLTVTFSATGSCTVTGTTVHITGAGSCSVTASQAGNGNYNAAADVTQTFAIAKADQTITFTGPPDQGFGTADFQITATATSGLPVTFSVTSGPCTVTPATSPANVHITGAGTCVIKASQAGNANYNAAPDVSRSFSISKANQTITFGPLANKTFGDPDFMVSATASSNLTVGFSVSGNCTVNGTTIHIVGAGTCSVTASQPGDANYNPAPDVVQSFTIAMADQTITFAPIPAHTYGDADFTIAPTASSGLPVSLAVVPGSQCSLSGTTVHITAAGSCSITASQPGNANWNAAANVTQTFAIAKANQTITFAPIPDHTYGDADFAIAPTASSGLPVSLAVAPGSACQLIGLMVHITSGGTCSITASQAGSSNYNAAPNVTRTFTIHTAAQTITFAPIPDMTFGGDFAIDPVSDSRLPVSVTVDSGPCTLDSATSPANVHMTGVGVCSITASQAGNANYSPATPVTRTFTISNSPAGSADGAGLKLGNGGTANFHVDAGPKGPTGNLSYDGPAPTASPTVADANAPKPPKPPKPVQIHVDAKTITAFGIAADGGSAWFAGVTKDGQSFLVYVEDNSPKTGPKPKPSQDIFQLWLNGVLQTGDGSVTGGKIDIKLPTPPKH